ncbi:MAG: helix-turn-helix domain-containing protein [Rhizomicrobium sp.]
MTSNAHAPRPSPWFNTAEAADYLGTKAGTLKNWRHRGEGPKYHVINKRLVRYHCGDLDTFARGEQRG